MTNWSIHEGSGSRCRWVNTAAIDDDDFVALPAPRRELLQEWRDKRRFVQHRNDDRNFAHLSAPKQLLPRPAVQPKQWDATAMSRPVSDASMRSLKWMRSFPPAGSSSIWLKSQS